jgi:non-heme chloroperoxidase
MTYSMQPHLARLVPHERHRIMGAGGVSLAVQHWGNLDAPPLLLIHAFGMSHPMWAAQIDSDLARQFHIVTFDHRGHGESDRPTAPEAYADGRLFADDIAAVIAHIGAPKVHVAAWSVSGALLGDYLALHGGDRIASVTLIGAVNALGPTAFALNQIGPAFADPAAALIYSPHLTEQLKGWAFVNRALTTAEVDPATWAAILASSVLFEPQGRGPLVSRDADHGAVYARLAAPILLIHAQDDRIVPIAAAERLAALRPDATTLFLPDGAHAPQWEHAAIVNAAIAAHAAAAVIPA